MASIVKVDQIQNADGTVEYLNAGSIKNASLHSSVTGGSGITALGTVASGTLNSSVNINSALSSATFPTGHIVQVKNYFTNAELTCVCASNQYSDLGTFNVSITPTSQSNKILVMLSLSGFNFSSTNYGLGHSGVFRRKIGSGSFTTIGEGQGDSIWNASFHFGQVNSYQYNAQIVKTFLDSPNTETECTYGIAVADHNNGTQTFYLNRMGVTSGEPYAPYLSSSIFAMEVVA